MERRIKLCLRCFLIGIACLYLLLSLLPAGMEPETDSRLFSNGKDEAYLVLSPGGTLVGWGSNDHSLIGNGCFYLYPYFARKTILRNVVSADIGFHCAMALDENGTLWGWGAASLLLREGPPALNRPIRILEDVASFGLGSFLAAAVKTDGSLWIWGRLSPEREIPVPMELMRDVTAVTPLDDTRLFIWKNSDLYLLDLREGSISDYTLTWIATGIREISYLIFSVQYQDHYQSQTQFQLLTTEGEVFLFHPGRNTLSQTSVAEGVQTVCPGGLIKEDDSHWIWKAENGQPTLSKQRENVAYAVGPYFTVTKNGRIYIDSSAVIGPLTPQSMNTVSPVLRNLFLLGCAAWAMTDWIFKYREKKTA